MTQQHPITPPPGLVDSIWNQFKTGPTRNLLTSEAFREAITKAAQWGADQELEACCEWFQEFYKTESWVKHDLKHFRAARRPKPPSLKEQALTALNEADQGLNESEWQQRSDTIRRALEQLDD